MATKIRRVCPKGHTFYKSSDCFTCPTCEAIHTPEAGFSRNLVRWHGVPLSISA